MATLKRTGVPSHLTAAFVLVVPPALGSIPFTSKLRSMTSSASVIVSILASIGVSLDERSRYHQTDAAQSLKP